MLPEVLYLKASERGFALVVHDQVQHRGGLKDSEITRPVRYRTIGHLEQLFKQRSPPCPAEDDARKSLTNWMERSMRLPIRGNAILGRESCSPFRTRAAPRTLTQRFSTAKASPAVTYPQAKSRGTSDGANWLTMRSKSVERRSRTCAAARPALFRIPFRFSLRRSSKICEKIPARSLAIGQDVLAPRPPWAGCPEAANSRSFLKDSHSNGSGAPDSPVSIRMQRNTRARCSPRSV
jgi:hypothetical protein